MIQTPKQIQEAEKRAFASGASAEQLMEQVGQKMFEAATQFLPTPGTCIVAFGKGHNGGDALVCARFLSEAGWHVILTPAFSAELWAPLTRIKWNAAGRCQTIDESAKLERIIQRRKGPLLLLDGLLGIGASGPLREPILGWCRTLNRWRSTLGGRIAALDVPSGLDAATGASEPDAIRADWTLTVGFAKPGLLTDGSEVHVGRLAVMPLPELEKHAGPSHSNSPAIHCAQLLSPLIPRRTAEVHKGECGRIALLAGNIGTVGAACLSAKGALRSGAGLVTLYVPETVFPLAATRAPEECMVLPYPGVGHLIDCGFDAIGMGPGLGKDPWVLDSVEEILRSYPGPAVLDADALNVLGPNSLALRQTRGLCLLTPHPGEMKRLFPESSRLTRFETVSSFTKKYPVTLLLKGSRTLLGESGSVRTVNTTGNPGMASGGMGDVLTGVCTSLLGQGLGPLDAGSVASWACGRGAELLISSGLRNEESLLASDVAETLGSAMEGLRRGDY